MSKKKWNDNYMKKIGLAIIKYKPLFNLLYRGHENAETKKRKEPCLLALGKEFNMTPTEASRMVKIFDVKYMKLLSDLYWNSDSKDVNSILEKAPEWVRKVEAKVHRMPEVKLQMSLGNSLRCRRGAPPLYWENVTRVTDKMAAQLARHAHAQRSAHADAFKGTSALLLGTNVDDDTIRILWEHVKQVSLGKLRVLACAGDNPLEVCENARMLPHDWTVVDVLLLYDDTPLLNEESYRLYEQLQPLIQVFHLAQAHNLEEGDHPLPLRERWAKAHQEYTARGLTASLVLLQRRWCDLKQGARNSILGFWRHQEFRQPLPIHISVAKRFPHIITSPQPTWEELVRSERVYLEPYGSDVVASDSNEPDVDIKKNLESNRDEYVDTEDDLILIERDIETVELEDDEDDNVDEYADESGEEKLVIDEPIIKEENPLIIPSERSETNIDLESENVRNSSSNSNIKAEEICETTNNASQNGETNMEIDETSIMKPSIIKAAAECLNNDENNRGEIADKLENNQQKIIIETDQKVIENNEQIKNCIENTQSDETALNTNDITVQDNHLTMIDIHKDKNSTPKVENNENNTNTELALKEERMIEISIEPNAAEQKSIFDTDMNATVFKQLEIEISNQIDEIDKEEDTGVIAKLRNLDPDKMQTEITFDSDSDDHDAGDTSPVPGCSGLQNVHRIYYDNSDLDPETKGDKLKNGEDSLDVTQDNLNVGNFKSKHHRLKVKSEIDANESGERVSPNASRKRFVFDKDGDEEKKSESSEDDLSIAEMKKQKLDRISDRIQFEAEEEEEDELNLGDCTFGVSVVPKEDLRELLRRSRGADGWGKNVRLPFDARVRGTCAGGWVSRRRMPTPLSGLKGFFDNYKKTHSSSGAGGVEGEGDGDEAGSVRVAKRVELPNIEEVRRINRQMLTAQVTPITLPAAQQQTPQQQHKDDNTNEASEESSSPDDAVTEDPLPSEAQLVKFLDDLSITSRISERSVVKGGSTKGSYCCLARRHRAVNDARRRLAAKAGNFKPPQPLALHSGAHLKDCHCCCVHLVEELVRDDVVAKMQHHLRRAVSHLLNGKPIPNMKCPTPDPLQPKPKKKKKTKDQVKKKKERHKNGKGDESAGESKETTSEADSRSDDDSDYSDSEMSESDVTFHSLAPAEATRRLTRQALRKRTEEGAKKKKDDDSGYQEWIRQKNLASRFFEMGLRKEIPERKSDANTKPTDGKDTSNRTETNERDEISSKPAEDEVKTPSGNPEGAQTDESGFLLLVYNTCNDEKEIQNSSQSDRVEVVQVIENDSPIEVPDESSEDAPLSPRKEEGIADGAENEQPFAAVKITSVAGNAALPDVPDVAMDSGEVGEKTASEPKPDSLEPSLADQSVASASHPLGGLDGVITSGDKVIATAKLGTQAVTKELFPVNLCGESSQTKGSLPLSVLRVYSKSGVSQPLEGPSAGAAEGAPGDAVEISKKLNAAMKIAETKLKSMGDVKNVKLTIDLHNDMSTVCIAKVLAKRGVEDDASPQPAEKRPTLSAPGAKDKDSKPDVSQTSNFSPRILEGRSLLKEVSPVVVGNPRNKVGKAISLAQFIDGKDPSTLRLMCLNKNLSVFGDYLFLTEVGYPVSHPAYCTIAPWRRLEKVTFPSGGGETRVTSGVSQLLETGSIPDELTIGDKHYKRLLQDPLVYAQVYSMVVEASECRRLLIAKKPMFAYSKASGEMHAITVGALRHNNVGLMCDDNNAVKELVKRMNLCAQFAPRSGRPLGQQIITDLTPAPIPITICTPSTVTIYNPPTFPICTPPTEVIELDSDD